MALTRPGARSQVYAFLALGFGDPDRVPIALLKREGNILTVEGLDAIDGTPVLDIKPYIPGLDSPAKAVAPSWTKH